MSLSETIARLRTESQVDVENPLTALRFHYRIEPDDLKALLDAAEAHCKESDRVEQFITMNAPAASRAQQWHERNEEACRSDRQIVTQQAETIKALELLLAEAQREIADLKARMAKSDQEITLAIKAADDLGAYAQSISDELGDQEEENERLNADLTEARRLAGTDSADLLTMLAERTQDMLELQVELQNQKACVSYALRERDQEIENKMGWIEKAQQLVAMAGEIADLKVQLAEERKIAHDAGEQCASCERELNEMGKQLDAANAERQRWEDMHMDILRRAECAEMERDGLRKLAASERAVVVELPDKESFTILDISDALAKAKIGLRINTPGKLWGPV